MTNKYRMIQVGTGGQGNGWCARFLPPNIADGRIEVVAAVDINPDVHINAQQHLGLPPEKCYTDIEQAFDENPADFCSVVVPPAFPRIGSGSRAGPRHGHHLGETNRRYA